jgi:hypothetical protein
MRIIRFCCGPCKLVHQEEAGPVLLTWLLLLLLLLL